MRSTPRNTPATSGDPRDIRRRPPRGVLRHSLGLVMGLVVIAAAALAWLLWPFPNSRKPADTISKTKLASPSSVLATSVLSTPNLKTRRAKQSNILDPINDGWESEDVARQCMEQLKVLARGLSERSLETEQLDNIASPRFSCEPLRPTELREVHRDTVMVVRRQPNDSEIAPRQVEQGLAKFQLALDALAAKLGRVDRHVHFKVVRVNPHDSQIDLTTYYEASGRTPGGEMTQQTATWQTQWLKGGASATPRLESIKVSNYEEVTIHLRGSTLFADCTEAVLGGNRSYHQQLAHGAGYWKQRLERHISARLLEAPNGLAIGDVNGDWLDDVYICQPGGLPDRLYLQNRDGTVSDVSSQFGIDLLDWSYSALLVDLDNDGDQDLAVLTSTQILLFENVAFKRFKAREPLPGAFEYGLSAADFDNDGNLDLYACNYFAEAVEDFSIIGQLDPLYNANRGGRNALFRNNGNWRFRNVTEQVGLSENNSRLSRAAAWEDFDNDGDLDLYVANDFGQNNLYRNDGSQFRDVAPDAGAVDANFGMSVSWADYDHDGLMDLYIGNMYSSAGNRVTFRQQFKPDISNQTRAIFQRMARGNTLLRNAGSGTFSDLSEDHGVTMGRWAWASLFADVNNDTWQDLLVTNGYLTQESSDDL